MKTLAIVLFCIVSAGSAFAAPPPLLLQHPTVSRDAIAFDFAGEIWTVPREGATSSPASFRVRTGTPSSRLP